MVLTLDIEQKKLENIFYNERKRKFSELCLRKTAHKTTTFGFGLVLPVRLTCQQRRGVLVAHATTLTFILLSACLDVLEDS